VEVVVESFEAMGREAGKRGRERRRMGRRRRRGKEGGDWEGGGG